MGTILQGKGKEQRWESVQWEEGIEKANDGEFQIY